jgi:hypothetical protein
VGSFTHEVLLTWRARGRGLQSFGSEGKELGRTLIGLPLAPPVCTAWPNKSSERTAPKIFAAHSRSSQGTHHRTANCLTAAARTRETVCLVQSLGIIIIKSHSAFRASASPIPARDTDSPLHPHISCCRPRTGSSLIAQWRRAAPGGNSTASPLMQELCPQPPSRFNPIIGGEGGGCYVHLASLVF